MVWYIYYILSSFYHNLAMTSDHFAMANVQNIKAFKDSNLCESTQISLSIYMMIIVDIETRTTFSCVAMAWKYN